MTKLTIQTDKPWLHKRISGLLSLEIVILQKVVDNVKKIYTFKKTYGQLDRDCLYGKIDDMTLIEWEGEIETRKRLENRLKSFKEINFEHQ
jgi:hypothetical protein